MGGAVFPPCCLTRHQIMVEVMKIMATSFKRSHAVTATLNTPDPAASHRWPMPSLETPGHSQESLGHFLVGSLLLSPGSWCTQDFVFVPSKSLFLQSCVSSGGVNGNFLQDSLCHTQVCCTQSPCPCSRPLLTCTPTGDTQTFKGRSGSVSDTK